MRFYFKHPSGWEFSFQRSPMESEKFYALVALAAGALIVILFLGGAALK